MKELKMDMIRRTSFVFYKDWLNTINELPQEIQFDHWGTVGMSEYFFDKKNLRYNPTNIYDRSNWITGKSQSLIDELEHEFKIF